MAEPLKTFFSPGLIRRLSGEIARVDPEFRSAAFVRQAADGLERLELMDRARQIARSLAAHLPQPYPRAIGVLLASLKPEERRDQLIGSGMTPFFYLPHLLFVAEHGLQHFDLSMQAQYELTRRFTAEFSVRAFIAADPERVIAVFERWVHDENAHVRRLVSEGTRLRLPWAARVPWLDAHPERVVELLTILKDDPSPMVRRSVANNLNDIGKVRADLLTRTATTWLEGAPGPRRALLEHALRSAVKRGDRDALRLLGFGAKPAVVLERVTYDPSPVHIGQRVAMHFALRSTSARRQALLVDAAVHFVKSRGNSAPKVFKVGRLELAPRDRATLRTSFSLAVHTTRTPRPGSHAVDVIVNGHAIRAGSFRVVGR